MTAELPKLAEQAERVCLELEPGDKDQYVKDSQIPGLFLRVTPRGKTSPGGKYWQLRYHLKVGEKWLSRKTTLGPLRAGRHGAGLTVKQARTQAEKVRADVRYNEKDPISEKKSAAKARAEAIIREEEERLQRVTVGGLFNRWNDAHLKIKHKDGGEGVRRLITTKILSKDGEVEIQRFGKRELMAVIDHELSLGKNRTANLILSNVKQMFTYAVVRGLLETNPFAGINKSAVGGKDVERERVLCASLGKKDELTVLFEKLPDSGLIQTTQLAIKIILSTCCRIGELASARWDELDLEKGEWFLPEEKNKSGRMFTIYLSHFATKQLNALRQINGWSEWVLPSREGDKGLNPKNLTKQISDRQKQDKRIGKGRTNASSTLVLPYGRWTPHDLRRTGATIMAEQGVLPDLIERCLNHAEQNKMKRIYQRHDYSEDLKRSWRILGDYLDKLE